MTKKSELWTSLRKLWKSYIIAKADNDFKTMRRSALAIRDVAIKLELDEIPEFDVLMGSQ